MKIPFQITDWNKQTVSRSEGLTGFALTQLVDLNSIQVRVVEYSAMYEADHWCTKGHLVYCLEGEMEIHLEKEKSFSLSKGMSFFVSDDQSSHKTFSENGAKLLIVDGDILK